MVVSASVPPVRRAPLILALLAGAVVVGLRALAPAPAEAAPALAQIGDFNRPVYVVAPPRDIHQVFVVERGGTVRLLVDGTLRTRPFLDIRNLVQTGDGREDERGLLSIAFAPDYATSGRFYAYYTSRQPPAQRAGDIVIDEFRRSAADPEVADPATRRTLVAIAHDQYQNHNGGQLAFGPDAMLYAGTGDGGGGGDPLGSGQSVGSQLGKLLRLDVRPGAGLYPADNPFGAAGPSVWSMGLRNPFRFSFDRLSGDLAIGDVGQNEIEEIDFVPRAAGWGRGANFGWNILEGSNRYGQDRPARPDELPSGYVGPVIQHPHSAGWCSIAGGYVVRDPALPELYGRYVYSDYCKGDLYSAVLSAGGASGDAAVGPHVTGLSSLGEDGCGRIYATSIDGPVYRLATTRRLRRPGAPALRHRRRGRAAGARRRQDEAAHPPEGRQAPAPAGQGLHRGAGGLQRALPGGGERPRADQGRGQEGQPVPRAPHPRGQRPRAHQGADRAAGAAGAEGALPQPPAGAGAPAGHRHRRQRQPPRPPDPGDPLPLSRLSRGRGRRTTRRRTPRSPGSRSRPRAARASQPSPPSRRRPRRASARPPSTRC